MLLQVVRLGVVHSALLAHVLLYVEVHRVDVLAQVGDEAKGLPALVAHVVPDVAVHKLLVPDQSRRLVEGRPAVLTHVAAVPFGGVFFRLGAANHLYRVINAKCLLEVTTSLKCFRK